MGDSAESGKETESGALGVNNDMQADVADMRLLREGNSHSAFSSIFVRHRHRLLGVANRVVRDPHEADDVVQETFLRAMPKVVNLREDDRLGGYLRSATFKGSLNSNQKRDRRPRSVEDCSGWVASSLPADTLESAELQARVRDVLSKLSEVDQQVLFWHHAEDCSLEEIADRLDSTVPNVKTKLFRARRRFREAYGEYLEETN